MAMYLKTNDGLETGLYFLRISKFSMIFLIKEIRNAILNPLGDAAHRMDVSTINMIIVINPHISWATT